MTKPRRIIPGATSMATRRCSRREYRLTPKGELKQLFRYALAVASERHGVLLHAATCLPNHYHLVATDPLGKYPAFLRDLNGLTARVTNAQQGRWEAVWSSQRASLVQLVDRDAMMDKLVYTLTNPAKHGLVDRLSDWEGFTTRPVDYRRGPQVVHRPKMKFGGKRTTLPKTATLHFTIPEAFGDMTPKAFVHMLQTNVSAREAEFRAEREAEGRRVIGMRAILKRHHTESPTSEAPRRGRDPAIASKDTPRRIAELAALRRFRDAHRAALERWRAHVRPVTFPYGTYQMRGYPGVVIGLPPPTALAA